MAIEIEYGDEVLEFPDGTSDAVIKTAMQKYHLKKSGKMPSINSGLLPEEKGFDQVKSPSLPPLPLFAKLEKNQYTNEGNQNRPGVKKEELFPRTAKSVESGESYPKQVLGAGLDVATLPGRALASIPDGGESLKDIEGERFVGKVLRHPATAAMALAAPFTGGGSLAQLFGMGAVGAGATQLENMSQSPEKTLLGSTEAFNPLEAVAETGLNVIGGKAGQMAGQYVLKPALKKSVQGLSKLGDIAYVEQLVKAINPTPTMKERGFKKPILKELKIGGDIESALKNTNTQFDDAATSLRTALTKNPTKSIDLEMILTDTPPIPGYKAETEALVNQLRSKLPEFGGQGLDKDILASNEFKRFVGSQIDSWGKSDVPYKEGVEAYLKNLYKNIDNKIIETAEAAGPEISSANKKLSQLIPIKTAIEKRYNQSIGEDPGFLSSMFGKLSSVNNIVPEILLSSLGMGGAKTAATIGKGVYDVTAPKLRNLDNTPEIDPEMINQILSRMDVPSVGLKSKPAPGPVKKFVEKYINPIDDEFGVNTRKINKLESELKNMPDDKVDLETIMNMYKQYPDRLDDAINTDIAKDPRLKTEIDDVLKKFPNQGKGPKNPSVKDVFGELKLGDKNFDQLLDIYNKSGYSKTGDLKMTDIEKLGNLGEPEYRIIQDKLFPMLREIETFTGTKGVSKDAVIQEYFWKNKIKELSESIDGVDVDPSSILRNIERTGSSEKDVATDFIMRDLIEGNIAKWKNNTPGRAGNPLITLMERQLGEIKKGDLPKYYQTKIDALKASDKWNRGATLGEISIPEVIRDMIKADSSSNKKKK